MAVSGAEEEGKRREGRKRDKGTERMSELILLFAAL
jgi:hypothetical protein